MPLELHAPRAGDQANAKVSEGKASIIAPGSDEKGMVRQAAGLLALGQTRPAEHAIESYRLKKGAASAPLSLLYVRAMASASDMPDPRRIERTKSALDEVLKAYPNSWEAKLAETELTIRKKGASDGVFAALKDMGIATPSSDLSKLNVVELFPKPAFAAI
jgi:hypothetical protein